MYAKLVFRNAKRSVKDYLIYIVTMTICVTLFYSSYYKVVVIRVPLQGQNATIDKVLWIGLNLLPQDGFRKAPTMALCF